MFIERYSNVSEGPSNGKKLKQKKVVFIIGMKDQHM